MKKIYFLLLLTAFVSCSKDSDDPETPKSAAKSILSFSVNGNNATINDTEKSIQYVFPSGADVDLTSITPVITVSEKATVSPKSGEAVDFTNVVDYTVIAEDGSQQVYKVKIGKAIASQAEITRFSINNVTGVITSSGITVTLPAGTNLTSLTPVVDFTGKSIKPAPGQQVDFTHQPVVYEVTAENGTVKKYNVTVSVENNNQSGENRIISLGVDLGLGEWLMGVIDEVNKKITITVPYSEFYDLTSVNTKLEISDKAVSDHPNNRQFDFTSPVKYIITAENGDKAEYMVEIVVTDLEARIDYLSYEDELYDSFEFTLEGVFAAAGNKVLLGGQPMIIISENRTNIKFQIPVGFAPGQYDLTLEIAGKTIRYGNVEVKTFAPEIMHIDEIIAGQKFNIYAKGFPSYATDYMNLIFDGGGASIKKTGNEVYELNYPETFFEHTITSHMITVRLQYRYNNIQSNSFDVMLIVLPYIESLEKEVVERGVDNLIIKGKGFTGHVLIRLIPDNGIVYPDREPSHFIPSEIRLDEIPALFNPGEYTLWVIANSLESNAVKLTIK